MAAHTAKDDSSQQVGEKKDFKSQDADKVYPSGPKFILLIISAFIALFFGFPGASQSCQCHSASLKDRPN